jgi:hypothetical protein
MNLRSQTLHKEKQRRNAKLPFMMKRFPFLFVTLLIACTPLGDTDVEITNLFSLDNLELRSIKFSQANGLAAATFTGSFTNLPVREIDTKTKLPNIYQGLPPLRLAEKLGLQTIMEARSKAGRPEQFPDTFIFSAAQLSTTFRDADNDPVLTKNFTSKGDLTMTFKRESCKLEPDNSTFCTYTTDYSAALLDLEFLGPDAVQLFNDILTGGAKDEDNFVSGTFSLTFAGDKFPPSDTEAVLKMRSSDGKIFF